MHKTKEQFGQDGPITVHCSAGVGRTGVFITLSIVLERMQYEGVLDVFQTVRILRSQRPAMVQTEVSTRTAKIYKRPRSLKCYPSEIGNYFIFTQDQYQFCYRAALEYLGSFDHYAN